MQSLIAPAWRRERGPVPVARRRRIVFAVLLVDTIAAGAFHPLMVLYLSLGAGLSVSAVGLLLTVGGLAALGLNPVTGNLVDRIGAQRTVVLANLCCGLGYLDLLVIINPAQLALGIVLVAFSQRLYWAGWPVFIAERVAEGERLDRWFAVVNALKSAALGLGAAVAAIALAVGSMASLRGILAISALTSLVSAAVFFVLPLPPAAGTSLPVTPDGQPARADGWRAVLGDRPYLVLTAAHTALTFAWLLPAVVLPVYFVRTLGLPSWVASCAFAVNTVMSVALQSTVTRLLSAVRRTRAMVAGAAAFLAAFGIDAAAHAAGTPVAVTLVLAGIIVFSVGEMAVGPAAAALAIAASRPGLRGRYSSLFQMSWTISTVAGPAAVGALLQAGSWALWSVLGAVIMAGALGVLASERLLPAPALRPAALAPREAPALAEKDQR
ncbi:MAG TPA: MFS transporter [Streptosporangiaceae bacterium]|nr:MFS transporter [Streptosporangiaceae bacterium]